MELVFDEKDDESPRLSSSTPIFHFKPPAGDHLGGRKLHSKSLFLKWSSFNFLLPLSACVPLKIICVGEISKFQERINFLPSFFFRWL
ncbi:unnamed protein product [Lactuca virosa]|uniref:Uncharacterized protein n=1 Tax=Lactuca virosa TaxID=75947 RepID=A0AAU9MS70_9ASTR|nr:unnamed protein product [Lactuca virosa]